MNIFTKFSAAALLAGMAFSANAQELGKAAYCDPWPNTAQTSLQAITLGWSLDGDQLELVKVKDYDQAVLVTFGGKTYEIDDYDIYYNNEMMTNGTLEDPNYGNELIIGFSTEAFNAGYPTGVYTIDIPEGLVENADGKTNAEQTLTFTKVNPVAPASITPAEGLNTDMSKVTLTFNEPIALNPGREQIKLLERDVFEGPVYYIEANRYSIGEDGKSLVLNLTDLLKEGVWYSIEIPELFVTVGENECNARVYTEYMYWTGMNQAKLISAPDFYSSVDDIHPFVLKWDQPIHFADDAPDTEFVIGFPDWGFRDGDRKWIPADWYETVHVYDDGTWTTPTADLPANGVYLDVAELCEDWIGYRFVINFPAKLVMSEDNLPSPPLSYTFNVPNIWSAPNITASAGVVDMIWPGASWTTIGKGETTLIQETTGKVTDLRFDFGGWNGATGEVSLVNDRGTEHGITINLNDLDLADGNYTIIVPQAYVWLRGTLAGQQFEDDPLMNAEVVYQFGWKDGNFSERVSSVGAIPTGEAKETVYDLQGRRLNPGTQLQKGIYIVNGKKLIKL